MCELHLARTRLRTDVRQARQHLQNWKALESQVDHRIVHEMAAEIDAALMEISGDFVIHADAQDLDYKAHVKALQDFLLSVAGRDSPTQEELAGRLNVSRQTLIQWNKKAKPKKKAGSRRRVATTRVKRAR